MCVPAAAAMAITDEFVKLMMAGIAEAVSTAMSRNKSATGNIDHRAIGGPPEWDS